MSAKQPVTVELSQDKKYAIEAVAMLTGYTTGYIRNLERDNLIPMAKRDEKGWRYWGCDDVVKIIKYKEQHHGSPIAKK